ncbi:hypothetical protein SNE40_014467 [Patella caerulea]|uniref:Uncharacterized protein n=1 Tax=Patella caerulea TaxID=87958 RepID=A0AAN8JGZ4_PATCE
MDLGKSGLDGVKEEEEETSHEPAIRTESSDGQLANTESVKTLDTGSEVPSTDKTTSSDRPDSKTDDCDIKPEMTVDVYPAGCNSDSGISMPPSPDSITEDCRNRTETLSDEEINELYLGNVSAKNRRRRGIFGTSMSRTNSEETSEYNGESPDRLKVPSTPERKVSSVSFDLDVPEDYSHLQRKKSNPGNGDGKHISFGGFEEDAKDEKKSEDTRRWSRVSFQSNASEASYGSTPRGVASHVRRDSIALAMNGIPVLEKPKRFTMFRGVKEVGEVTKNPNSVLERVSYILAR